MADRDTRAREDRGGSDAVPITTDKRKVPKRVPAELPPPPPPPAGYNPYFDPPTA